MTAEPTRWHKMIEDALPDRCFWCGGELWDEGDEAAYYTFGLCSWCCHMWMKEPRPRMLILLPHGPATQFETEVELTERGWRPTGRPATERRDASQSTPTEAWDAVLEQES